MITYVWHLAQPGTTSVFAMTYADALGMATDLGWTETDSWVNDGRYATTQPSKRIVEMLKRHRATPSRWRELVFGLRRRPD